MPLRFKTYLCAVLHHGEGGQKFAEELKKRLVDKHGVDVRVVVDWSSSTMDKYDALDHYLSSSKYCVVAMNKELMADSWKQECVENAKRCKSKESLSLIPVGIDDFSAFKGYWSMYNPMVFGADLEYADSKFDALISRMKFDTVEDKWVDIIRENRELLMDVEIGNLLDRMRAQSAISDDAMNKISAVDTRRGKMEELMEYVLRRGVKAIKAFIRCLTRDNQDAYDTIINQYVKPSGLSVDSRASTPTDNDKPAHHVSITTTSEQPSLSPARHTSPTTAQPASDLETLTSKPVGTDEPL